ncbi:MAG: YfhO family protein, partial [Bacteroidales bacterium]|nr:YfhO family protein [Bacteroidales bacterium]
IPNFVGGPSVSAVSQGSPFYKSLIDNGIQKQQAAQISKQVPLYWGGQDGGTSGPVYIGAVIVFLFVLGLFVVKGRVKWWLLAATIVSIVLAWGKHCLFISDLFIDYFPGYNKFRTVSMILVIAELTIPLLGILAVRALFGDRLTLEAKKNAIKKSLYIVGGIALFFVIFPGLLFNFSSDTDTQIGYPDWLIVALQDTRAYVLRMDALRSLFFVLASAIILWFSVGGKIKTRMAYILFAVLIVVDLWTVDKRYVGNDRFAAAKEVFNPVKQSVADQFILQDTTALDYRVLNLAVSTFNDATTSYFHKSIGGYHGAKMKRYQELIEHRLSGEISAIINGLQSVKTIDDLEGLFAKCPALNMLNTRYVIYNPEHPALENPDALSNAWTVSNIRWADNADAEIAALNDFNPTQEAVIDKRFENVLGEFTPQPDSTASIRLTDYKPNHLTYEYLASKPQMTVFSEIYYPKGWTAYIDGQPAPHVCANYVLRAMVIPEGKHQIEFKFAPSVYVLGEKISLASSVLLALLIAGSVAGYFIKRRKKA